VQRTLERITLPEPAGPDWKQSIRQFMVSVRDQLRRHPSVIDLMSHSQPPAVAGMAAHALDLMRSAGLEWEAAYLYFRVMIWRILGFTAMECTLRAGAASHVVDPDQPVPSIPTRFHLTQEWPAFAPPEARALSTRVDLDEMYLADVELFIHGLAAARRSPKL
jgi:hypothetical protein